MQVFLCDTVTVQTFVSLPAQQRNTVLRPLPTPDLETLYQQLISFILFNEADVAQKARLLFRQILGDCKMPLADALTPALVVTVLEGFHGCHYRVEDEVVDCIFLNKGTWLLWREALDIHSQDSEGLQAVVIANLVHELAHRCISLRVETSDAQIEDLQLKHNKDKTIKQTLEYFRVPWMPEEDPSYSKPGGSKAEAGQYMEWKLFGGTIFWDQKRHEVEIRVGPNNAHVLTGPMVHRGVRDLLLDYVEEFGLSLSTSNHKTNFGPRAFTMCEGVNWDFNGGSLSWSEQDICDLRRMAAAETAEE